MPEVLVPLAARRNRLGKAANVGERVRQRGKCQLDGECEDWHYGSRQRSGPREAGVPGRRALLRRRSFRQ
jgi:hypothetical protein